MQLLRKIVSSKCEFWHGSSDDSLTQGFFSINPSKINPISGRPIGYKLVPEPSQLMLAHPDSIAYQVSSELNSRETYLRLTQVSISAQNLVIITFG